MVKGKVHYIEVIFYDEEEDEIGHIQNIEANQPKIEMHRVKEERKQISVKQGIRRSLLHPLAGSLNTISSG